MAAKDPEKLEEGTHADAAISIFGEYESSEDSLDYDSSIIDCTIIRKQ